MLHCTTWRRRMCGYPWAAPALSRALCPTRPVTSAQPRSSRLHPGPHQTAGRVDPPWNWSCSCFNFMWTKTQTGMPAPSILTGVHSHLLLLADSYFRLSAFNQKLLRTVAICYQRFVTFHLHSFPVILSHVSFLSFKKMKKKLRQEFLSAAHVYYVRSLVACVCFGSPSGCDLVVLSKVFVVRYYRVGCLYYWRSGGRYLNFENVDWTLWTAS